MTTCRDGCGACCEVIVLGFSQGELRRGDVNANPRDRRWILEELEPITAREAFSRAPWMREMGMAHHPHLPGGLSPVKFHYRCRLYDEENRSCGDHDNRPDICRLFPEGTPGWPRPDTHLPPSCSFNADLGRPVAPVPVRIR